MRYTVHPEKRLVVTFFEGKVTDSELVRGYVSLLRDPLMRPGFNELSDWSGEWEPEFSENGINRVGELASDYLANSPEGMRTAIFAPRPLLYGLGRMYEQWNNETTETVKLFKSSDEALAWLGLPPCPIDSLHRV